MWAPVAVALWLAAGAVFGAAQVREGKGYDMDYGPFQTYTISPKPGPGGKDYEDIALKGIAIHVGRSNEAAVCFDTDLMRYSAGWTGDFLDISKTHLTSSKGSLHALIAGDIVFRTGLRPGWSRDSRFDDPRALREGPLPKELAHYKGLYRHGDQVALAYTVAGANVLELPDYQHQSGVAAFTRTVQAGPAAEPLYMLVCELPGSQVEHHVLKSAAGEMRSVALRNGGTTITAWGKDLPAGSELDAENGLLYLRLPALKEPARFRVCISSDVAGDPKAAARWRDDPVEELQRLRKGGPSLWPEALVTKGRLGPGSGAYLVDTLTIPEENRWHSWMRLVALDFFSDGRAAVSTWNGDVWIVSGIDDKLERVTWKRYAAGLFEPLGLKIVDDTIYLTCRDQITRLHDLNSDGEADFYENFNNDTPIGPSYHAFAFELHTDSEGNFYYTRCGHRVDPELPLNGGMIRVSKDGSRSELFATGMRAPNGMSVGPNDQITCSDNQGNWVPASRLNLVHKGGFYGYVPHARRETVPEDYDKPICWLPVTIDNSSGGQVWVTSERWGPFHNQLLHTSYGKGTLFLALMEKIDGQAQGGVVQFPLKFDSGIMRGRFHPLDGQLYVCGLRGWQTGGAREGALQRVRYTGKPVHMPRSLRVGAEGIELGFTASLDRVDAGDPGNYAIEQWNYLWSDQYGSPEFSVANPNEKGRDEVAIKSIQMRPDGRTVFLEIPGLQPVMQMRIQFRIRTADGALMAREIYNTIHRLDQRLEGPAQGVPF